MQSKKYSKNNKNNQCQHFSNHEAIEHWHENIVNYHKKVNKIIKDIKYNMTVNIQKKVEISWQKILCETRS